MYGIDVLIEIGHQNRISRPVQKFFEKLNWKIFRNI